MTRIAVLVGSIRPESNTLKTAALLARSLGKRPGVVVDLVDPRPLGLRVPGSVDPGAAAADSAVQAVVQGRVKACAGVAVVTPEYDGSFSAVTKLLVEALGYPSVLVGKPVTAVGVAAGSIGALRALEHLRGMLFNAGALVLPTSPSVAVVHKRFDDRGECLDAIVASELDAAAGELVWFAERLR